MTTRIAAAEAMGRVAAGARIVDIRPDAEFAREHAPGSLGIPQDRLSSASLPEGELIFTCRSGNRTNACADAIAASAGPRALILEGGLEAWKRAGGKTVVDRRQPIDLMRQVQIAAGSLVLIGLLLGFLVHPGFFGLSAFVGAGLTFAGLSGWCGMALLLQRMPWNRVAV